jgi:hypothetical protein
MHTNANLDCLVGALGLIGASVVLAALGLVFVHALLRRRAGRAVASLVVGGAVSMIYVALMLGVSLTSSEEVLAAGAEKYLCELDCRLAYSVVGVRRAKTLHGATAAGEFLVVTLRTRFDENTSTPRRGDAPLTPNPRRVEVADERGRRFPPSELGRRALASAGADGLPLETPLRPGQSYTTELVFDLPADARAPTLLVTESLLPTRLIIGHENSLFHRKTRLGLEP